MKPRPVEKCLNDVAGCDLYIGLFAWRYGQVQENSGRSITELEYRTAVDRRIPVLIFLLQEEVPWLPKHVDSGDSIKKLRQELESKHLVSHFNFPIHFFDAWLPRRPTFGVNLTSQLTNEPSHETFQDW